MTIEALKQARQIIWRYRHETPLGNQPHMIAHEADETIECIDQAIAEAEKQEPVASADYDMIDRFLRCNLNSDEDYAEYSAALDRIYTHPQPKSEENGVCLKCGLATHGPQPAEKQEPVAWRLESGQAVWFERTDPEASSALPNDVTAIPLYTHPQPKREWQGLTDEEKISVCRVGPVYAPDGVVTRKPLEYRKELEGVALMAVRQAETKLKEKNNG